MAVVLACALVLSLPFSPVSGDDAPAPEPPERRPVTETRPADGEQLLYEVEIEGIADADLRELVRQSLSLVRLEANPPRSRAGLRRRTRQDVETVAKVMRSRGYYAYKVEYAIDTARDPALVVLQVDPGPLYQLTRFEIVYEDDYAPGRRPDTPSAAGLSLPEPARSRRIVDAADTVRQVLSRTGFPLVSQRALDVVVDHDTREVRVTQRLESGPLVTFGPRTVEGLERVRSDYVRRVADIPEGAVFDTRVVDEARRRLFATGLFSTVSITWADESTPQGGLPVTIEVVERERRTIAGGVSLSSTEGFGAEVSWTHRNLLGRNETLEVAATAAQLQQRLSASILKPNWATLGQSLRGTVEVRRSEFEGFDERAFTTEAGVIRPLTDDLEGELAARFEVAEIEDRDGRERDFIFALPGRLTYDTTDSLLDPTEGVRVRAQAAPTRVLGDADANYLRASINASTYFRIFEDPRVVLAGRSRIGSIVGASRGSVPATQRFFAGGGGSIRGYEFQTVGPLDERGDPVGGLSVLDFSAEARIGVWRDLSIVPFLDGGNAFRRPLPGGGAIQWAAGLGFRYNTVVGPVRLDFAFPLNARERDGTFEFFLSLGQAF